MSDRDGQSVTPIQLRCLRLIKRGEAPCGQFSARTINSLDARGFLVHQGKGYYELTPTALAVLEKANGK